MARAIKGMLIECDPSIKSLVVKIDQDYRDIIIEELDDTHLLIDPSKLTFIKKELNRILADNSYNPFDDEDPQAVAATLG
ncbi:TFIIH complex subunit tfb5 [Pichia californica]|uniref:General transcription and DNA repair factor IIH subunit TFB5 n=1 Tax=Pichia californica TaxID=460514 RepID=A0A9P6WHF2_9ASCO|nr:TFIIH complex subunit tfb5 [[Candida] californica]KAG0687249.1 TFIIH complex subunit tfb5 [[Candida] californica]